MCGLQGNSEEDLTREVMRSAACGEVSPSPPAPPAARSGNKELLRQQLLSAGRERAQPPRHRHRNRGKLKFHHQALPQEYLDHYERSLQRAAAARPPAPSPAPAPAPSPTATPSPPAATEPGLTDESFRLWAQRLAALRPASSPSPVAEERRRRSPAIAPSKIVSYEDLPYMGEMTLNNSKPRRGRKPKKADICHLIYENYGTVVPGQPARRSPLQRRIISTLLERRRARPAPALPAPPAPDEPLNLCVRDLTRLRLQPPATPDQPNAISVIQRTASPGGAGGAEGVWAGGVVVAPLLCCPPAEGGARLVLKRISELLEPALAPPGSPPSPSSPAVSTPSPPAASPVASPAPPRAGVKRKRSAIFIPPASGSSGAAPRAEVSICKFKFTGGSKPSLQEKKMLSVDAGGNFRYYTGTGSKAGKSAAAPAREGGGAPAPAPVATAEGAGKRKSRKSVQREKLERTFKEKGFLIQTQQLQSAEGATYCKFRQLRKFTRYLFRSWRDYLPGELRRPQEEPPPPQAPDTSAQ